MLTIHLKHYKFFTLLVKIRCRKKQVYWGVNEYHTQSKTEVQNILNLYRVVLLALYFIATE